MQTIAVEGILTLFLGIAGLKSTFGALPQPLP
jgi:hypothetical protein